MQLLLSSSDTVAVIADPLSVLRCACDYHCPPTVVAEDIIIAWLINLPSGRAVTGWCAASVTALHSAARAKSENARATIWRRFIELLTSISQVLTMRLTARTVPAAPIPEIAE